MEQEGVVGRRQLLAAGLTPGQARREVVARRWRRLHDGVFATFTGSVPERAQVWAALLRAGPDAAAAHRTALWLTGVIDEFPGVIEVAIPHERRSVSGGGVRVHRMRALDRLVHPSARPPRLRLEVAVLAVTERAEKADLVIDLVLRSVQRRLTTAGRLRSALEVWPRHRWRGLVAELLSEVADGVASALELRYVRDVERAHGLPRGERNRTEGEPGRRRYRDVRYSRFGLVAELDGREAHPDDEAFRDLRRDNASTLSGDRVLRYGWRDVVGRPCEVAAQVVAGLRAGGWRGTLRPCGPACPGRGSSGPSAGSHLPRSRRRAGPP
jgi:hypothetical protein